MHVRRWTNCIKADGDYVKKNFKIVVQVYLYRCFLKILCLLNSHGIIKTIGVKMQYLNWKYRYHIVQSNGEVRMLFWFVVSTKLGRATLAEIDFGHISLDRQIWSKYNTFTKLG